MKFEVETEYLDPIELGKYEHVTVRLPDGRSVTVYDNMIYVATEPDVASHKNGQRIWEAASPQRSPYGKTLTLKAPPPGTPV